MTFMNYWKLTDVEHSNIYFTWSASLPQIKQLEIQQKLSSISSSNIGEYYKVSRANFAVLSDYEVIAQKITDDGNLMIMLG